MSTLRVEAVENGFVVYEGAPNPHCVSDKIWAFESADSLAVFMKVWGGSNTKSSTQTSTTDRKGV